LGFSNWPVIYYKPTSFLAPSNAIKFSGFIITVPPSADIELANRDSSEEMSEAASENGNMGAERAIAAFQSRGSWAYLTASPAPF
jgi:hypothetical protein